MALSNFVVKAPAQQRIPKCKATADQIYFVDNGQSIKELHPGSDGGYGYQLNILGSGVDKFTVVAEPYMKTVSLVYKNDTQAKWQIYFQPKMARTISSVQMRSDCTGKAVLEYPLTENVELANQ
jgi:hypothetical protein